MFCPKCATLNIDNASYCRTCGANISLVPLALTGQLSTGDQQIEQGAQNTGRRHKKMPSVAEGIQGIIGGLGFIFVALLVARFAPAGRLWWFWLLIPAFTAIGKGIADIVRAHQLPAAALPRQQSTLNSVRQESLAAPSTGQLLAPPPSVTEGTTRHLGAEAPTRHLDS